MKTTKSILILLCLLTAGFGAVKAQELDCVVTIDGTRAQTTDKQIFTDMETAFARFMNERKWTNDFYSPEERIKCALSVTINSMPSIGYFNATVQIQSSRPVYGTSYESLMFNFADRDWAYEYTESQPMDFNENVFTDHLTSMLAFYAYMILGVDYDSYSLLGGSEFYNKALNIVTYATSAGGGKGWEATGSNRNRYWLIQNYTNKQMEPFREGLYYYHRMGLDVFENNPDEGRKQILVCLQNLEKVDRFIPNSILKISFFDTKRAELIDIYSEGDLSVRRQAYQLAIALNPTNTDKYGPMIGK